MNSGQWSVASRIGSTTKILNILRYFSKWIVFHVFLEHFVHRNPMHIAQYIMDFVILFRKEYFIVAFHVSCFSFKLFSTIRAKFMVWEYSDKRSSAKRLKFAYQAHYVAQRNYWMAFFSSCCSGRTMKHFQMDH